MATLDTVLTAYVECALWSSTDDDCEPLDANYTLDDISPDTLAVMRSDCEDFLTTNAELLGDMDPEQIGHDFWLTRNGHGAGFWDRGLGERGDKLTTMCKPYGSFDLYVGDDGLIYGA